ncbi:RNA polymerase factor sigma-54 [bacterium SCSIO 12643]|nr:RNA polymerase factor sigma-54 [bacterium SCSIO 12643]
MLSQKLQLKLQQKLSPQQIQLMKLLQVPTAAIEQRIKEELEENPALDEGREGEEKIEQEDEYSDVYDEVNEAEQEFDFSDYVDDDETPSYKLNVSNHSKDDEEKSTPLTVGASFTDLLLTQMNLRSLTEKERVIGENLIGNLDESGYLRRDIEAIVDDLAFTQNVMVEVEDIEAMLDVIQDLDPAGVGARSLQECLLLQLKRKPQDDDAIINAVRILENGFDQFTKKHYSKLIQKLDLTDEELKEAIDEITKLNPKPGSTGNLGGAGATVVVADFQISVDNGQVNVLLNGRNAPELRVSKQYANMIDDYQRKKGKVTKAEKDAMVFVKQKLDSAKWFIDAIVQRQNTLLNTMNAIVEYQKPYFLSGDETDLKPMILKNIADMVEMDISTISRVANSKYAQTPYGTFPLKYYFSESLTTQDGEEVSTREVKNILSQVIEAEDKKKPLTDQKLMDILREKGYNIARRTVAKYREQLNIPVARLRKEL